MIKKPESICIFGDSTAWGAWDTEKGGWVNRLWLHVGKRDNDYVEIYNCSISGGTTNTILERFESEAKIRNADALIFQTGGNDASYKQATGKFLVPIEQFAASLEKIIERAKKLTPNIIFMDLKNCDESKTVPVSWIDLCYTNEHMKRYVATMKEICNKHNILFLDIDPLDNEDFEDGLHPNAQGHQKIYGHVQRFLAQHNWI